MWSIDIENIDTNKAISHPACRHMKSSTTHLFLFKSSMSVLFLMEELVVDNVVTLELSLGQEKVVKFELTE